MNRAAHGVTDGGVDHAVSLQRRFTGEGVGDDLYPIVTTAFRARVAGMSFALVLDLQAFGRKGLREALTQMLQPLFCLAQGKTFLKGRTVTRA